MLTQFCALLFCVACVHGTLQHPGVNGVVPFVIRPLPTVDMTGSQWNLEVPFDGMGALGSNAWIPDGGQTLSGGAWMQNGGQALGGGTWMQNDGGLALNGGAWMQNGGQALGGGGGIWMQNGDSQGMYLNQFGMNNLYHNNWETPSGGLSSGMFVPGYQQNYQVNAQYEGGFQGSYMRPAMSFYPMPGMYGMGRRNCFFNRGFGVPGWNQNPVLPQQTPIFQVNPTPIQPVQIVPRKTVQPVQPVQHLNVETLPPTQVQPKNLAGRVPFQIPKAKTPWEGAHIQTRLV